MKPNDLITLTAFMNALNQLEEPLPTDIQNQLNAVSQAFLKDDNNLGKLDAIAESYKPLDEIYQKELTALKKEAGERNKGLPPDPLPKEQTQELTNAVIETFNSNDSKFIVNQPKIRNLLIQIRQFITGGK